MALTSHVGPVPIMPTVLFHKDGMLFVWVMLKDMPAKGGYGRV